MQKQKEEHGHTKDDEGTDERKREGGITREGDGKKERKGGKINRVKEMQRGRRRIRRRKEH